MFQQPQLAQSVPEALRERPQWVCHVNKVPLRPRDGAPASVSDSSSWGTFDQALARATHQGSGIGFVFTEDDPFVGVDFDHVRNPLSGELADWLEGHVEDFGTYSEISPSGEGLHLILRAEGASFDGGAFKLDGKHTVEVYRAARYFTVTGNLLLAGGTSRDVEERQEVLRTFLSRCERVGHVGKQRRASGFKANLEVVRTLFGLLGVRIPDGGGGKAPCPFHDDQDPSLFVSEKGYRCFSTNCKLGGGGAVALRKSIARLSDEELVCMAKRTGQSAPHLTQVRAELRAALRSKRKKS